MKKVFLFLFIFLIGFSLLRCIITPSPIYGGDEYAYLASAHCTDSQNRLAEYQKDPGLQRVNDPIYDAILKIAMRLSEDPTLVMRLFNLLIFYGLVSITGFYFLKQQKLELALYLYLFLLGLLPSGIWVLSIMPDVVVSGIFSSLVFIYIYYSQKNKLFINFIAGVTIAALAYIKPHAIAFFMGFVLYLIINAIIDTEKRKNYLLCLFVFLLSIIVTLFLINDYFYNSPGVKPLFIGSLYKSALAGNIGDKIAIVDKIKRLSWYGFGFASFFLLIFPLAIVSSISIGIRFLARERYFASNEFQFFLLSIICTGGLVGMASLFSILSIVEFESLRIYGRYLLPVFPLWLALSAMTISNNDCSDQEKKYAILVGASSLILGAVYLFANSFRIYPWDCPELFSLFSEHNDYWKVTTVPYIRELVVVLIVSVLGCFILQKTKQKLILLTSIQVLIAFASLICSVSWQSNHARNMAAWSVSAKSCAALIPKELNATIIASERYGYASWIAYGLNCQPAIVELPKDATINQKDIPPGVDCIITTPNYSPNFYFSNRVKVGILDVFIINERVGNVFALPKKINTDNDITISLTDKYPVNYTSIGFSPSGNWGAHTEAKEAEIVFPFTLEVGNYLITINAWSDLNQLEELIVFCDSKEMKMNLARAPQSYSFEVHISSPTDRVIFCSSNLSRKYPWGPLVGAAVSSIEIKKTN
ncbi:MAG: hypothetical protein K2W99_04960 [Chthoniobacterales bacterium]|nr:hypothetical protein [Chthoniobacterales bacterium]